MIEDVILSVVTSFGDEHCLLPAAANQIHGFSAESVIDLFLVISGVTCSTRERGHVVSVWTNYSGLPTEPLGAPQAVEPKHPSVSVAGAYRTVKDVDFRRGPGVSNTPWWRKSRLESG